MRRAPLLLLVALLLASGCLDRARTSGELEENGVPSDETRAADEYWLVWVHGQENRTSTNPLQGRAICSIVFDHEIDARTRTLRHANETAPREPRVVIAFDVFDDGHCPLAYGLAWDASTVRERVGRAGSLTIEVRDDGSLRTAGKDVPLGQRLRLASTTREGTDTYRSEILVENLGAWPHAGIVGPAR